MNSNLTALLVGILAAIPGLVGIIYTFRVRREQANSKVTQFGTELAQTAFKNMETQVSRLVAEQTHNDSERDTWDIERAAMTLKIGELSSQVHIINLYVQLLLATLDSNKIPRPPAPEGWTAAKR